MTDRIALITGANKGLGYETARRLKALGMLVTIGARDAARGEAAAQALDVDWLSLDVTDEASVAAAAAEIERRHGRLDILVNNAGVPGARKAVADITGEDAEHILAINLVGPVRVIYAFLPLLKRSTAPVIVNVSTGMGSFALTHDETRLEHKIMLPLYSASKAAVTMLTAQYAKALPEMRINAADPGYTATDFNDNRGSNSVEEGADPIVHLATVAADGPTGMFMGRDGIVPW